MKNKGLKQKFINYLYDRVDKYYFNKIKSPLSFNKLLKQVNEINIKNRGLNTLFVVLNGKDSDLVLKEWSDYAKSYNKIVDKLNNIGYYRYFLTFPRKNEIEPTLFDIKIIFNKRDYNDKSKIVLLGNSFSLIETSGDETSLPSIELKLNHQRSEDKYIDITFD